MKKIILIIVLIFNLVPYIYHKHLVFGPDLAFAQNPGGECILEEAVEESAWDDYTNRLSDAGYSVGASYDIYYRGTHDKRGVVTHVSGNGQDVDYFDPDYDEPDFPLGFWSVCVEGTPTGGDDPNGTTDCNGDLNGTAYMADCGCIGGNTGIRGCDCNGDPDGAAYMDACGCIGGNTGVASCPPTDCNGDSGGSAYVAACGCIGGNTGIASCPPDCNGDIGGTAYMASCGCIGGNTGIQDCNSSGGGGYTPSADCNGDIGGTAYMASCGCIGGNTGISGCPSVDCNGDIGGTAYIASCGCIGGNTGISSCSSVDCYGDTNGTAYIASCGCIGGNTGISSCPSVDCNGDANGTAYIASCGCIGGNTGIVSCNDCHGDPNGMAFLSSCGCIGGNTGVTSCPINSPKPDCHGDINGSAYWSICGCIGGNTGITACPPKNECDPAATAAGVALTTVINDPGLNNPNNPSRVSNVPTTDGTEAGFVIGKDSNGNIIPGPRTPSTANTSVSLNFPAPGDPTMPVTTSSIHYHPNSNSLSAEDLRNMGRENAFQSTITSQYEVGADNSKYAFSVTDPSLLSAFTTAHKADFGPDGNFLTGTAIDKIFTHVQTGLQINGLSLAEAYAGAMAYVLESFNAGVTLYKADANGNFKKVYTSESGQNYTLHTCN